MRPTALENSPLTGQLRSHFEKLHGIGGAELHPNGRRQPLVVIGGNGLLLSSLWDAAFDSGLVTFDDLGNVIASPSLGKSARLALALEKAPPLQLVDEQRSRLAWHRSEIWVAD